MRLKSAFILNIDDTDMQEGKWSEGINQVNESSTMIEESSENVDDNSTSN